ncbi:MAG: bifunctional diguanylate cyclase/phosphodiesterase [Luteimonas sp.]
MNTPVTLDALTGLSARSGFLASLRQQIDAANAGQASLALLVVDVNGFAQINGAHGYAFGDEVLRHVARQLVVVARSDDQVARIGDNRFALILPNILNRGHAELAARKINRLLEVPLHSNGDAVCVFVTTGIALCPQQASTAEHQLRQAESALSTARRNGEPLRIAMDTAAGHDASDLWNLEMQLGNAIQHGELTMHYQPIVCISNRHPVGVEALMRWTSPTLGVVPPDAFIPLAERSGQIKALTAWALNTALRQANEWRHKWGRLSVAVNLPGVLTTQRALAELVENALGLWGAEHIQLVLEITERSLMDREQGFESLERIRASGVKISIDDFGTGYSCLAYFKDIPVDELKIDKSFVHGMATDRASADIASLIVELGHRFGLSVAAEGVEDEATLRKLEAIGCDVVQGYLIAKPMPSAELQEWLTGFRIAA